MGGGEQDMNVETPPEDMSTPPVDPCMSVTCGQNATCSQGTCQCDSGFEGANCESFRLPLLSLKLTRTAKAKEYCLRVSICWSSRTLTPTSSSPGSVCPSLYVFEM